MVNGQPQPVPQASPCANDALAPLSRSAWGRRSCGYRHKKVAPIASTRRTNYNRWYQAGTTGQSLGKNALHLRLVSEETGQPFGMLIAFVRDICHFIDGIICYVGFLFPLWDAKRQTIADKIVRTVVIPE